MYGSVNAYFLHRKESYTSCAMGTTFGGIIGAGAGAGSVIFLFMASPLLTAVTCLGAPFAVCAVVAKYFDEDAKKP